MLKRILVALSGTPYTASAVAHALELARECGGSVTGTTCVDPDALSKVGPVPIGGAAAAHALAEHRERLTRERVDEAVGSFRDACAEAGVPQQIYRETGSALDELTRLWRFHDLTVMGLRGLFEYGVTESPETVVSSLLHAGVRPVLAVCEEHRVVRHVLVAYNGSMGSAAALKTFVQYGLWPAAPIRIITFEGSDHDGEATIEQAADYCRAHGREVETATRPGPATPGLEREVADWNADLLVMGATHRGRLARLVLGDTALAAMRGGWAPLFLSQ